MWTVTTETATRQRRGLPGPPPAGVVIDLDDTLYPHVSYLDGAAAAVGEAAAASGLNAAAITTALRAQLRAGSDRGGTIDRALTSCGVPPEAVAAVLPRLLAAFVAYQPDELPLYPGTREALAALRARYPLVCLTDGSPALQRAKLAATGLAEAFDAIVITDELGGRPCRKPHPSGLRHAAELIGRPVEDLVVVGDRPGKDVAIAIAAGARSIRVTTGEYADAPDSPTATAVADSFATAAELLLSSG
jgi:FMN phosphatase YigB (HAD superfamily)